MSVEKAYHDGVSKVVDAYVHAVDACEKLPDTVPSKKKDPSSTARGACHVALNSITTGALKALREIRLTGKAVPWDLSVRADIAELSINLLSRRAKFALEDASTNQAVADNFDDLMTPYFCFQPDPGCGK
jgi:hypothetical protein